jgi:hypothetical protein
MTEGDGNGGKNVATGQDIANAAQEVLGAPYRVWYEGASIPMWLDDGVSDPPAASHIMNYGVECTDLVNYALERCGLSPVGGTGALMDALVDIVPFDANSPGVPGAVAFTPYYGPALSQQGHILLYTGPQSTIQALFDPGVTDAYTDVDTAGFLELRYYALLPGVDYSGATTKGAVSTARLSKPWWVAINKDGVLVANGDDYSKGWYDTGYHKNDWSWHGPKES